MKVKQEKPEDKEILALAEQIAAENKNRLAATAQQQQKNQSQVGQSILGVLRSKVNNAQAQAATATATTTAAATLSICEKPIDEESISGHFGWDMLGKSHMAYILRNGEKYCSVRMAEMKALNKFLVYLHQDIYNCTRITSYYLTEAESRLLNEINFKHCDQKFGREHFTKNDVIVRFDDAKEFHAFLCFCYTKLVNGDKEVAGRSGFIQINKESVVPYTLHNNEKYVPLFYFEGETENLKQKVNKIEGWDLSYLKFCCKVQGIRNELFAQDSCSVISLEDIRSYFPPGTHFEDFWPKKGSLQTQLLVGTNNSGHQSQFPWTKQPDAPQSIGHQVSITKPVTLNHLISATQPNSHLHNLQSYSYRVATQNAAYHTNQVRNPTIRSYTAVRQPSPSPRQMSMHNYYGNTNQGPPALVPTSQGRPIIHFTNSPMNAVSVAAAAAAASEQVRLNQMNYHHNVSDNSYNRESVINQQTIQSTSYGEDHTNTNGQIRTDSSGYKIIPEPSPNTSSHHIPYAMQKAMVLEKLLPSINLKPYNYDELLVTISDIVENFFDNAPVQYCESVMKVLKIDLYKPNVRQMEVLFESGKCLNLNDIIPLVLVKNVIEYMPQLKYMLAGILSSKRQRVS